MMVDSKLRVPFHKGGLHVLRFLLRLCQSVAIQIETVMAIPTPNWPWLAMLIGVPVRVPNAYRVIECNETLVAIGIFAC